MSGVTEVLGSSSGPLAGDYCIGSSCKELYTVNFVTSSPIIVTMDNPGYYSWTKTSGNCNYWYTYNSGRNMYCSLSYGSVSFRITRNGQSRTVTFYKY